MKIEDFIVEMEKIMELDKGTLQESTALGNLLAWNSLSALEYVALVDTVFKRKVTSGCLASVVNIRDLYFLANSENREKN